MGTEAPVEYCPRNHGKIKAIDRGAYWTYDCLVCAYGVKTHKPPITKQGDLKKFAPER